MVEAADLFQDSQDWGNNLRADVRVSVSSHLGLAGMVRIASRCN